MKSILQNQIGERGCIYVLLNESFDVEKKLTSKLCQYLITNVDSIFMKIKTIIIIFDTQAGIR